MRPNFALVPQPEASPPETKQERDRRGKAVFDGAYRVRVGAEGKLYLTLKVEGEKGVETWLADFSVSSAVLEWDTDGRVDVFQDAETYLSSVARAVPKGRAVRLSRRLERRLRGKALEAIITQHEKELAEMKALLARYTFT